MVDCNYCDKSFEEEKKYIKHLKKNHSEELKSIDKKRVEKYNEKKSFNINKGFLALGGIIILGFALVFFLFINGGSQTSSQNSGVLNIGSDHYHGTIEVIVNGERIDFSRPKYQLQDRAFHFEDGNGITWHAHARNVPLDYAMNTVGITFLDSSIKIEDQEYTEQNYKIQITANGQPIDPKKYILKQDDNIKITITSN